MVYKKREATRFRNLMNTVFRREETDRHLYKYCLQESEREEQDH